MGTCGSVLEVDGMVSVQVGVIRDTVSISTPEGTSIVVSGETERVSVFTQTVKVGVSREIGLDTKVLRLENDGVRTGSEEDLLIGVTDNREGERRGSVVELDRRVVSCNERIRLRARKDRLGDLVTRFSRVGDFEVNTRFYKR